MNNMDDFFKYLFVTGQLDEETDDSEEEENIDEKDSN